MSEVFDPYYKWLGIPPAEQPPHHYRLLGINLFETDVEVIDTAAERQMTLLRTRQTGKHAAFSQQLLNEIAAARSCLLDPAKRAAYDESLRKAQNPLPVASPLPAVRTAARTVPVKPQTAPKPPARQQPQSAPQPAQKFPVLMVAVAAGGGMALLLSIALLVWWFSGSSNDAANSPNNVAQSQPRGDVRLPTGDDGDGNGDGNVAEVDGSTPMSLTDDDGNTDQPDSAVDGSPAKPPAEPPKPPPASPQISEPPKRPPPVAPSTRADPPPAEPPPTVVEDDKTPKKLPIPTEAEQAEVAVLIEQVVDTSKLVSSQEKLAAAQKLFDFGKQSSGKPAEKFCLLLRSMQLAGDGGDAGLVIRSIDAIESDFVFDAVMVKRNALTSFAENASTEAAIASLVENSGPIIEAAKADDRIDEALALVEVIYKSTQRPAGGKFRKQAYDQRKQLQELHEIWQQVRGARAALEADPDDPAANLLYGRYLCLTKSDFAAGLPYLAKGENAALRLAALQDTASRDLGDAGDAAKKLALGDAWYDAAKEDPGLGAFLARAHFWYSQAAPSLEGLDARRVELRLDEIAKVEVAMNLVGASVTAAEEKESFTIRATLRHTHSSSTPIWCLAFSPDNATLAMTESARYVRLWDVASRSSRSSLYGQDGVIHSIAYSPNGRFIASGGVDDKVLVWDVLTRDQVAELKGHQGPITSVAFSPNGRVLACASADGTLRLFDMARNFAMNVVKERAPVQYVTYSPDGKLVAEAFRDGSIQLRNAESGSIVATLREHSAVATSAAFSPDSSRLVTTSEDNTFLVWNVKTRKVWAKNTSHTGIVARALYSPDGSAIVSVSHDGSAKLWHAGTLELLQTLHTDPRPVRAVAFSRDGKVLATAGDEQKVKIYDVQKVRQVASQ